MFEITLPDGSKLNRIASAEAVALVWAQETPTTQDRSRLQTAAMLFANSSHDDVKGILKGADRKAGIKAPMVQAMIAIGGMDDASARNRYSEHKTLWRAWESGFSFFDPTTGEPVNVKGWHDAVAQARAHVHARDEAAAEAEAAEARRSLLKTLQAAQPDVDADVLAEQAARVAATEAAEAEEAKLAKRAAKAAEDAGGIFLPYWGTLDDLARYMVEITGDDAGDLALCIMTRVDAIKDVQARDAAEAEAKAAHVKEAIAAERIDRLAAEHS